MWDALREFLGTIISFFYDLIPNVGVAIILLTIAVGTVLFPLTLKQTRSMKAMQEIQPEIKRLQKQYKNDKQVLQEKTMALYREKGVNPAAGCLPLLLQMPIWFALFQVLRQFAVDIVHVLMNLGNLPGIGNVSFTMTVGDPAKFLPAGSELARVTQLDQPLNFLWMDMRISPTEAFQSGFVHALPYLITIVVVMGTAYWQQQQTMARNKQGGADQQQQPGQTVMKVFPIFFGFISFTLPAGLVVYFAASQIFRIGQQSLILRMDSRKGDEPAGKVKPEPDEPEKKVEKKPEKKPDRGRSGGPAQRPTAQRRPQGSKKKRGKKRRRR
jgi:YidC/Oxa1 family membrane protein insertase